MQAPDRSSPRAVAASLYGVRDDALDSLGAFESDVFAFDGTAGACVLKVIDPAHRSVDQLRAEVDWLLALWEAGLPVARPVASVRGAWVERLDEAGHAAVAFLRAPGRTTRPADWTEARIEAWGALLGRLQAHARGWTPPGPRRRRLTEQSYLTRAPAYEGRDRAFVEAALRLARRARPLLGEGACSGLVHADLHHGNLLLHEERWTAIDFDDAAYGSFAFDLAMPLYYAVRAQPDRDPDEAAEAFLGPFLRGFRSFAPDPEGGAEAIATCLQVRTAELVLALWLKLPRDAWTDALRRTAQDLRDRTVEDRPLLSMPTLRRLFPG